MLREERTEVLVVGAGPVGMLTALLLSRAGVRVKIIDQESRTAARTYACALHPRTLELLHRVGLAQRVLDLARRLDTVGFYQGERRRAEARVSQLKTEFPFVAVLPQSVFEDLLEQQLKTEGGVQVEWNHQLSALQPEGDAVLATVDKLAVSAKGYIIPEMEWEVEKSEPVRASYVVGADGPNSFVAQSLKIDYESRGEPQFFAVYEFESDWSLDELRIALDEATTSVLWPLPGRKFRWSFQLLDEHLREFPKKDRSTLVVAGPELDLANRRFVEKLVRQRAPWFQGSLRGFDWATDVEFPFRVAQQFGRQRCWLAGDSAHQTGPAGAQSMNAGLSEADQLARVLAKAVREKTPAEGLETYNNYSRREWLSLLGIGDGLKPQPDVDPWVKENGGRLRSCLPALGEDLKALLSQLKLELG